MEYRQMKSVIEGLLFVAGDEGLDVKQIAEVLEKPHKEVKETLERMKREFKDENRGMQIIEIAGQYQLTTLPEHAPYFQRLAFSPSRATLSQAALETLAIIAYNQPITRVEIEEIRGVKSDRPIHTLMARGLICEVARADVVGRPILYGTTKAFLDYFGLNHIKDLPDSSAFEQLAQADDHLLFDDRQLTIDDVD